jgi:hypothetical protein
VLDLTTIGAAQADDSAHAMTVHERHAVQDASTRSQGDHSALAVLEPIETAGLTMNDLTDLKHRAHAAIAGALEDMKAGA